MEKSKDLQTSKNREFSTTRLALQQMVKELLRAETQEKEKTYKNKYKTIRIYISVSTLNVNGLNAPTKRQIDWVGTKIRPI